MTDEADTAPVAAASQIDETQELSAKDVGADEQPPLGDDAPLATDGGLPTIAAPPENDPDFAEVEPSRPLTGAERAKAHIRDVLAAQPYRGHDVHKDDLLAVIDALIDGPPEA